jgi:hypothetical protein
LVQLIEGINILQTLTLGLGKGKRKKNTKLRTKPNPKNRIGTPQKTGSKRGTYKDLQKAFLYTFESIYQVINGLASKTQTRGTTIQCFRKGGQGTRQNYQEEKENRKVWHYALFNAFLITL